MSKSAVQEIRPKVIFKKVEDKYPDENTVFSVSIPSSDIGGMTLLESSVLVSLEKLLMPTNIFEFGTYMGATSILLSMNSTEATVTTLDLPTDTAVNDNADVDIYDDKQNDDFLRSKFITQGAKYIKRAEESVQNKITQLFLNSIDLDVEATGYKNKFDFIFIDGGHDYETIKNDTKKALGMSKKDSIIIWHDYNSKIHGDVTKFVNEFSVENDVVHVGSTMLAIYAQGKYKELLQLN